MIVLPTGKQAFCVWFYTSYYTYVILSISHSPDDPSTYQGTCKAERDSAYYIACTADENEFLNPISVLDVFQTLQVEITIFRPYLRGKIHIL